MNKFVLASLLIATFSSAPVFANDGGPENPAARVSPASSSLSASPEDRFEAQIATTKSHIMSDPASALEEAREAGRVAKTLPASDRGLAEATSQWLEGEALTRLNRPAEAEPVIAAALQTVVASSPGTKLHGDVLKSSASLATNDGRVEEALDMLHEAFAIYENLDDKRSQAIALHLIGSIYYEARDYERVLSYYNQAQSVYPEDLIMTLSSHNNRGNALSDMGQHDKAEAQFALALKAAKEMESSLLEARILTNIASAQMMQGFYRKAEATALNGLRIAQGDAEEWKPYLWGVRAQVALAQGNETRARDFIERTFAGVDIESSSLGYRDYHAAAAKIYEKLGNYKMALQHLAAFKRLDDNGRDLAASTNSALMAARFDNANRELRISRLEAEEIQRDMKLSASESALNYMLLALASAILIIAALFFAISNIRRTRKEITAVNEQLYHSSTHDLLTGLPNRANFRAMLASAFEQASESKRECGVMIIDLDRFKDVNDTLGHAVGDQLLCDVADRLKKAAGDYGQPVRLGGDEFAMIIPVIESENKLRATAEHIIDQLSQTYTINDATASIGATIGGAIGPRDCQSIEQLTRWADLALYEGKNTGRGRYVTYRERMQTDADERHDLERDLREALQNGDLSIAYQSIVDAKSADVICYEALLRWNHPTRGQISPEVFIPIAEDARLIHSIGSWVLRTACMEAMNWPNDIRLAVNVSALQVEGGSLASTVIGALAASELPPERLELEVTESVFLDDKGKTDETLEGLRTLGIRLVLDDFGTGYSSLGYLRRASFSTIKIDRGFVKAAVSGSGDSLAIIRAIVSMADELGMQTTAEGIETEEEMDVSRSLGCSQMQGYLFSRPEMAGDMDHAGADFASSGASHSVPMLPTRKAG